MPPEVWPCVCVPAACAQTRLKRQGLFSQMSELFCTASYYPLKRFKRVPWTRLGKAQCAPCARAEWCLPAPLARHPFASHGPNLGRASRLTHSAPSSSQVSADHRAPGGRSSYPKALEGASGCKKGARHPPTSLRSNSSVVKLRHLSRAQEQQPVRVAVSVSALTACARDLAGALPSGM